MQEILVITAFVAFGVATLLNMTALWPVAIGGGFVAGLFGGRFISPKRWKELSIEYCPIWKRWFWMTVVSLIASQVGWASLLINI